MPIKLMAETKGGVVERSRKVRAIASAGGPQVIHEIKRYLTDRSPSVRSTVVDVVKERCLNELDENVRNLVSDKNSYVRGCAAECLGVLHEGEAIKATWLYPLLRDRVPLVRVCALESLAQIGDRTAIPAVIKRLQDDDALVRGYAAESLAQLGGRKYRKTIENALRSESAERAKVGFSGTLLSLGDRRQFPVLLSFLSSANYIVRCVVANALETSKLNPTQLQLAIDAVKHAARHAIARADKTTMNQVLKTLTDARNQLRT
ncbi:MAG: HEAT repeat domain-containing protein [Acidobacteriota bacterium]|nr:HEAT repeat domain-containing protein [Acidobacteriota bacterium]